MKGIVFTEFCDLVDETFGEDVTDRLLEQCPLHSGGEYTAVGTYDPCELHILVEALSSETKLTPAELQAVYGRKMFSRFSELYPSMFETATDPFSFLERVDAEIHVEVRKLYPDAEFPKLECTRYSDRHMRLRYRSSRSLQAFCAGLIDGCFAYFGVPAAIRMEAGRDEQGGYHDFDIRIEPQDAATS
jgi:hypothetical protein